MVQHLEQIHSGEEEVKKAIAYDPKDPKRVQQFEKLCRMGNFNHNMKVLDIKEGKLKVYQIAVGLHNPKNGKRCGKHCSTNQSNYPEGWKPTVGENRNGEGVGGVAENEAYRQGGVKINGNEKASLEDLLKPGNFDTLICCARNMAGYEENAASNCSPLWL
ncbi:Hypothetical predicted protein [Paramuricea clavata]|uniref:Uncharacterized protein n=1 Tax=Paramuricea clavata TaxID=317549 RepID=A0A6S7HLE4_PARCT|nr:Hypothetical predicted protein [Paramuricea clavata]